MNRILEIFYSLPLDPQYLGVLLLIFLAAAALVLGIFFLVSGRNPIVERLSRLVPVREGAAPAPKPKLLDGETRGLAKKLTGPLEKVIVPKKGLENKSIRLKLVRAGFRSERAFYNYLAAKIFLALVLPGGFVLTRFFYTITLETALICFVLSLAGFFLPDIVVLHLTEVRQDKLGKALPDALDLMVVCVEAGLGLDMTFKRVGDEIRPMCKDLSDEFVLTNLEIRAGSPRDDSFRNMSLRTGVQEINNLMTILIQTNRFGTSMARALRVHADAMRVKRRQFAEERAAKAVVKLIFPLILFIFPALMIVLAGPAAIKIVTVLFPAIE